MLTVVNVGDEFRWTSESEDDGVWVITKVLLGGISIQRRRVYAKRAEWQGVGDMWEIEICWPNRHWAVADAFLAWVDQVRAESVIS